MVRFMGGRSGGVDVSLATYVNAAGLLAYDLGVGEAASGCDVCGVFVFNRADVPAAAYLGV